MGQPRRVDEGSASPRRIGARFDVIERLGQGGMATVYRVRDVRTGEELALKQMTAPAEPGRARELTALFEREFYTLAQLSHPSVIEAHDFGLDSNGAYYTMELLDGGDLVARAPIEPREACRLFAQICSSLCLLHARRFVHRDISPRNVRFTSAGRAKLIDFGALMEMGPCTQTIGTPSCVAPEVVQHVSLDARTDLFSLGATLYFALTGRPAFQVRSFADLRAAWRNEPAPPSALVPGVPAALDALVHALLRIDPSLRPNSAFEVMQRLAAIAGVDRAETELTSAAYLTTPRLVAREHELRRFRRQLRKALMGQGSGIAFEAVPGLGRSRLLDACVLEAKTAGATVLRVVGTATSDPFDAARAIATELFDALPDAAERCAAAVGASDLLLSAANPASGISAPALEPMQADRHRTLTSLHAWIAAVAGEQLLVVAADDIEHIDEPSLALLASLAHGARDTRLLVILGATSEASPNAPAALSVLRSHCFTSRLAPLTQPQLEALFASVFGNTSHVGALSARIHALADGSPREALALAQQLLDKNLIRYGDGHWVLPAELAQHDLPSSLEEAFRSRIAVLSPLALRLAQTQALALGDGRWTRADYAEIAPGAPAELDVAIAALRKSGIVTSDGRVYTLARMAHRAALASQLCAAEVADRHLALARLCAQSSRPAVLEIHHLLLAGAVAEALNRLSALFAADADRGDIYEHSGLEAHEVATCLETAFQLSVETGRPPRECHELGRMLTSISVLSHAGLHRKYGPSWLERLELDSGLTDYRELPELEPGPRLMTALTRAAQRYEAAPPGERVYSVEEALKYLARYVVMSIAVGVRTRDLRLLASLPGLLEPFAVLSPVLHALWQNALSVNELSYQGRLRAARDRLAEVYASLSKIEGDQLKYADEIRRGVAYGLATIDATLGRPSLDAWLADMDQSPLQRVAAEYLRSLAAVYDSDNESADRYRKRAEVLALQASAAELFGSPLQIELTARVVQRDLVGVRRIADRIAQLAIEEYGWQAPQHLAHGWYQRLRGDAQAALAAFERCFELNDPERPSDFPVCFNTWAFAATGYVSALVELGRRQEAIEFGLRAIERCREHDQTWADAIETEVAVAEAASGEAGRAAARIDARIERNAGFADRRLAWDYEARARIAILAGDSAAAVRFAELTTRNTKTGRGHKLQARHGTMLDEARRAGIDLKLPQTGFEDSVLGRGRPGDRNALAQRALNAVRHVAVAARPQRILELLCEAANTATGQLYIADGERLTFGASIGAPPEVALDVFASGYFRQQLEDSFETNAVTEISAGITEQPSVGSWTSPTGKLYRFVALTHMADGDLAFTGLAALECAPNRPISPQTQLLARALAPELAA
jgi:tetratricopeptide (TPR) repeat protein